MCCGRTAKAENTVWVVKLANGQDHPDGPFKTLGSARVAAAKVGGSPKIFAKKIPK